MSDIKKWKQADVAFHPILGRVEIFYRSRMMPETCEVMTDKKIDIGGGRMSDCHIVWTKDLYESEIEMNPKLN